MKRHLPSGLSVARSRALLHLLHLLNLLWKFGSLEAWRLGLIGRGFAPHPLNFSVARLRAFCSLWPWKVCGFAAARSVLRSPGRVSAPSILCSPTLLTALTLPLTARHIPTARLRALCFLFSVLCSLTAAYAAVPQFSENVACEPIRIRLPKSVEATPTPPLESYRFMSQKPDGSVIEFDAFDPEQLWRRDQRLGAWADKDGNRYELVAPKSRRGGPYPRTLVTREEYDKVQERTGTLKPSALGMWIGEWTGATCGKPQALRPVGGIRLAQFAEAGNAAVLVFFLKDTPQQPYALIITPSEDPPARWRTPLQRALAGFASAGRGLSGTAQAAGGWITLDKPPYRLHTDLPKRDRKWLDTLLADMTAIRAAYTQALPEPKGTKIPTSVIRVFANPDEYRAHSGEGMEWSSGHFSSLERELVVMGDSGEDDRERRREDIRSITFHEGWHQYLFLITPGNAAVPIWFNEGHATFFETFTVKGGRAVPGSSRRRAQARQAVALRSPTGLRKLLDMSQEEFYSGSIGDHYAVAWALVSYLRTDAPDSLKSLLNDYYALLCKRKTQLEANDAIFTSETLRAISDGLEDYLR